jgi:hypothetical protein
MSLDPAIWPWRGRSGKESSRIGGLPKKTTSDVSAAASEPPPENPPDIDALRKARLEYPEKSPGERRKKMRYVGEVVAKAPVTRKDPITVKKATRVRRRRKATTADTKHSHPNVRATLPTIDEHDGESGYHQTSETESEEDLKSKTTSPEAAVGEREGPAPSKTRRKRSVDHKRGREERQRSQRRQSEPLRRRNADGTDERASVRRYEMMEKSIVAALTISEHLLLETTLDDDCQRASRAVTTSASLRYSGQSRLRGRALESMRLILTQHQNVQEKSRASCPASFLLRR